MKPSCLALIPARGGSKSIPGKNIKMIAGLPLIAHLILQCRLSKHLDRVAVSTDDPQIAEVSKRYGAEVIWRPAEISGDTASSESALLHALEHLRTAENYVPDYLVFLQCTSPLTIAEDIDGTLDKCIAENADTALSTTNFHYFVWRKHKDGSCDGINHDKAFRPRRQDREDQFIETGAVYVMKTEGFLKHKHRFFGKTVMHVMPAERCCELDEPVDFEVAEMLLRAQKRKLQEICLPEKVSAIVFDFDGVFTDNSVYVSEDCKESVKCSRYDGMGISLLRKHTDIKMAVLSTEVNKVVEARCKKLKIECIHGVEDKLPVLKKWMADNAIERENLIFVGNDVNDYDCITFAGCGTAVADSHKSILAAAKLILNSNGGHGAVRELTELVINKIRTGK